MLKIALITIKFPNELIEQIPLGIGYLSSYLKQNIKDKVEILLTTEEKEIFDFKPDLLCISSTTQVFKEAERLARDVKSKLKTSIAIGGYHITALPSSIPDVFDVGILGEGEETFLELVESFIVNDKHFNKNELKDIRNICFKDNNEVIITSKRPLIQNLDSLPYPERVIPKSKHDVYIFTSRGCPYNCIYCASSKHWKNFRQFSAEYVVNEMNYLINEHDVKSIYILDDLFIADKKRFNKIVELVEKYEINKKINFHGFGRANLLDEEAVINLKRMNFKWVRIGVESFSPKLLSYLKNKSMTIENILQALSNCKKHNLKIGGSFVFGTPGETEEDLNLTYNFIKDNRESFFLAGFYLLVPLPGTELWEYAKKENLVKDDMDWNKLDLGFQRKDFNWNDFLYLNKSLPRESFITIIKKFINDFEIPII